MAVRKISPQAASLARIMEQRSAAVHKSIKDTIRQAEEQVRRSEQIISQSILVIERAEKVLEQTGKKKPRRDTNETARQEGSRRSGRFFDRR